MKTRTFAFLAAALLCGGAQAQQAAPLPPSSLSERDRALLEQVQREQALRTREQEEQRVARARENCITNRGVDCDSSAGLAEWVAIERSRAEAVLDRIAPPVPGSASTGASRP